MSANVKTSANEGSARIYQFPAGGRAGLGGRRYSMTKDVTELVEPAVILSIAVAAGTTQPPSWNPAGGDH